MNQLEIFRNIEFGEIRTVTVDGEPWFVAKDIAEILQYTNTPKAIRDHVDEEDKLTERIVLSGQNREAICINESGLYSLIFSSKMSGAKRFKRWVTSEVLPQIRKTGTYQKPMTPQEMMRVQLGMIDGHEERIAHLENTMTIDYRQQQELKKAVNKRVMDVLGGKRAPAYKEISKKVFSECNHDIQDYFDVNSRNNVPVSRFREALQYAESWNPSNNTMIEIRQCNAGIGGADGV